MLTDHNTSGINFDSDEKIPTPRHCVVMKYVGFSWLMLRIKIIGFVGGLSQRQNTNCKVRFGG